MVRVKPTARFKAFGAPMLHLLSTLYGMRTHSDVPSSGLVITSANDGQHMPTSRHYRDEALDIRSKTFASNAGKYRFRSDFERALGPQFRVILEGLGTENEHFHAQVRKGHEYRTGV